MEDKRTALAIFISIVIVLIYSELYLTPYTRQAAQHQAATASTPGATSTIDTPSSRPIPVQIPVPTEAQLEQAPATVIETPLTRVTIKHLGAAISSLKLLHYRDHIGSDEPLDVVTQLEGQPLPGRILSGELSDSTMLYELRTPHPAAAGAPFQVAKDGSLALTFGTTLENGDSLQKTFKFHGDNPYLIDVSVERTLKADSGGRLWFEWRKFEHDISASSLTLSGIAQLSLDNHFTLTPGEQLSEELKDVGEQRWVTAGDKYFTNALIAKHPQTFRIGRDGQTLIEQAAGTTVAGDFLLYVGPKEIPTLREVGYDLHRTVDLGWFSFLAHPLLALIRLFSQLFGNFGLAIVALTLVIKFLFLPLTKASMKSMKAMSEIQPEIKALQQRIKDPTQLNQEMMALYKKKGVNPMGGCLPMLIQIPVFLGLYNALLNSIELRHAPFALWINDLSAPEGLPLFGIHIPVMVILMGISMFVQQLMTPSNMDPTQRKVMLAMPVVFTFLFIGFPAGLTLYWLINNAISIIQQMTLTKDSRFTPIQATVLGSGVIFLFAYVLTIL